LLTNTSRKTCPIICEEYIGGTGEKVNTTDKQTKKREKEDTYV
jgi:hypothetical protein